ncbi:MAG: HDOD domain-containing protein [Gammaproteobacteria bacterium]|nr:HDOD domain-containing protein [Gammaproteobacteria bacterium]MCW8909954.1 HDOD domain-containing protein [Gammaproteobacteria bacterium]MCW9005950.1 HDOD domain-containing protein [Gammaproteobacteria bacterium]MCW9056385.1 HDOD domain-containing protein [Gammaproteobacteria bacterium]
MAEYQLDMTVVKNLVPFRDLCLEDRQKMADKAKIIDLLPGDKVDVQDEHRWLVYLMEGNIVLHEKDEMPQSLSASDNRALYPLFVENAHNTYFKVKSKSYIARFDRQLFNTLLEDEIINGEQLETIEISGVEGQLFHEIMHAYNTGQLQLPSLPEIALKIKTAVSHPNVEAGDVARIIEADPAMAARLIQVTNSPLNRGVSPVNSIKEAILRLGLSATRNLVISLSMKQLFTSKSEILKTRMVKLYEHSVEIAAISSALAAEVKTFEADQLLLAGLIHDIGVIPVLSYIEKTGLEISDDHELEHIIQKLRTVVGDMVIKNWDFPEEMLQVIEGAENWQRDSGQAIDFTDMIMLAHIYSMLHHKDIKNLPKIDQVPAFKKLFSDKHKQAPNFAVQVLDNAQEEIAAVKQLLGIQG